MTDEEYMRKALEQAQIAYDKDEVPVGAVVVCRDRIIARAYNLTETLNDVTAHAEMQAITAGRCFRRQILRCVYALRYGRTVHYVCWSDWLVTNGTRRIWRCRPETRF